VGGTGKTPTVMALVRSWMKLGGKPGILSRGYRSGPDGNDEFRMQREELPEVPHVQHKDRFHAGKMLLEKHPGVDLLILDDGFQHRRLHRDLNILLCDASDPFGGGWCLPLGRLREPVDGVERADHILLTRAERCSEEWLHQVMGFFQQLHPGIPVDLCSTKVTGLRTLSGGEPVTSDEERWLAFSAIGTPDGFRHSLESADLRISAEVQYPDHHRYTCTDMNHLVQTADRRGCGAIVCTAKDAVKVRELNLPGQVLDRVHILNIEHDLPTKSILQRLDRD